MCGIAAIFSYHPASLPIDHDELRTIRDAMRHRGPDGTGEWFSGDGRVGLGHRRLTIIDLSAAGAQPMTSEDGKLVLIFNGEIYNYRELRAELEKEGCLFHSSSDTEVILRLYESRGEEAVDLLRGMFALALWDGRRGSLFLARDPFGIKPLYYADDGCTIRVASQVKALRAGGHVSSDPEPAGVVGFFLWGSVPEPYTLYREILQLPAGHTLWVDETGPSVPRPRFSVASLYAGPVGDPERAEEHLAEAAREAFLDSVRHHLIADVPVGAFLSAGIDSTAIVSLAREVSPGRLRTVTLAFEEFKGTAQDESPVAEETARRLGTDHETRLLSRDRFRKEIPRLIESMDQPSVDGVNSYFVSQAAAESGLKVALSGLGGDELLGGYPSFRTIPWMVRAAAVPSRIPGLGRAARPLISLLLPAHVPQRYAGLLQLGGTHAGAYLLRRGLFAPWELPALLGKELAREGLRRLDPLRAVENILRPDPSHARISVLESCLYMRNQLLRDTDWASMAHSLEVRVPLVDMVLWRGLAGPLSRSPKLRSKALLAGAPRPPIPAPLLQRKKTGFVVPLWDWFGGSGVLDAWRGVPLLQGPGFQGARRWSFTIFQFFSGHLPAFPS